MLKYWVFVDIETNIIKLMLHATIATSRQTHVPRCVCYEIDQEEYNQLCAGELY